ncbi:radical SAM protein [bacterium]|nr:radical SAM protein [candidate division CSSED10-310 bacterium]
MSRLKVLLLNPPGDRIYVRDYYCSKVSKANYIYHPVDLLMLSGTLDTRHEIRVIDGMTAGSTRGMVAAAIRSQRPDVIIFLTGVVSFPEDFRFMEDVKRNSGCRIVASGELFLENPARQMERVPCLDGAILDFTSCDILTLLDRYHPEAGFQAGDPIPNIVYRCGSEIIEGPEIRGSGESYEMAIPRHEYFPNHQYRYPFVRRFPFATVLTDFGCPHHCHFCTISRLGHKVRTVENVIRELDYIKRLGFKDIYFDDQTFGVQRDRTERILEEMIHRRYGMGFICFTRADTVDRGFLRLMKQAGCHTVVFGVESKSDTALKLAGKGLTGSQIRDAISWCQALGIRTVGTFVIGLPGMTRTEAEEISDFAIDLGLDFASFNVPAPRPGTLLRQTAVTKGWISEEIQPMDQSGSYAVMGNESMSADEVLQYRNLASRRFYLRPRYLFHRLMNIRTFYEFKSHLNEMTTLAHPKRFEKKH